MTPCRSTPPGTTTSRAARDALHFGKLLDRWCQNLRRVAGYDVQYFAVVEPQKRAAPHAHFAIRGTLPRAVVKQLTAATYTQVWWPDVDVPVYTETAPPVWDPDAGDVDQAGVAPAGSSTPSPASRCSRGRRLSTSSTRWRTSATACSSTRPAPARGAVRGADRRQGRPRRITRGRAVHRLPGQVPGQGPRRRPRPDPPHGPARRAGRRDERSGARRRKAAAARRADHVARVVEALRWEPCSPSCPNWLRYGIQPKKARPTMRPGCCRAKAHKPTHLGYGGRRVLVSRKWTAKDLADHRHDRRAHVLAVLGRDTDGSPARGEFGNRASGRQRGAVLWELAKQTDPDVPPLSRRFLRSIAHATRWRSRVPRRPRRARRAERGDRL